MVDVDRDTIANLNISISLNSMPGARGWVTVRDYFRFNPEGRAEMRRLLDGERDKWPVWFAAIPVGERLYYEASALLLFLHGLEERLRVGFRDDFILYYHKMSPENLSRYLCIKNRGPTYDPDTTREPPPF